ncbi:MAG TPA: UPF0262 family protein [Hyphomicrobiaceae bacterium]|nr:UPF0262 family protein [Hyphomicrobiaceae bacterium]
MSTSMRDEPDPPHPDPKSRLVAITLDEQSILRSNPNIEHERQVAIFDILDANHFAVEGRSDGPFKLDLSVVEERLALAITTEADAPVATHLLSLSPLRRIIKDYFVVCDTYYEAIRSAPPSKIQAIDMGRRGLHDEGSRVLAERLKGKVELDHDTARRLFTLICALRSKG